MFFVIVGIVIIFISFIIALFSLIREQGGREESYPVPESKVVSGNEPQPIAEQEDVSAVEPVMMAADSDEQDLQQDGVAGAAAGSGGPFPWEVDEGGKLADNSLRGETTDMVSGGQGREMSGEISVRDLQRKMD